MTPTHTPIKKSRHTTGWFLTLAAIASAAFGIHQRMQQHTALAADAQAASMVHVGMTHPEAETSAPDLVLPGTLQSWVESPVYARATGYVKRWNTDIGAHVTAGQVLAELDTPDFDQQVTQARADVVNANAALRLAQTTAERWHALVAQRTVSPQDADTKAEDAASKQAALDAAQANLARLLQLDRYKFLTSPINGIVTARNLDIGQLIDIGTGNGAAHELFHVADVHRMRVYVAVPESETGMLRVGLPVKLRLRSQPGLTKTATLTSTSGAVDPSSHTMLVELQIDNPQGNLLPGGYVDALFPRQPNPSVLQIPGNALIFNGKGTFVATITPQNTIKLVPVIPGRDFGKRIEILHGLTSEMPIVVSPPDSIHNGEKVIASAYGGVHP